MTLAEIAALTGFSVATVSKAFAGSEEISRATKKKIYDVARKYGCYDKYYKGPRDRKIVALLFPESESEYYGKEIGLLEKALETRGADAVVALTRFDPEKTARLFFELVYRMKVDGVIISGHICSVKNPDEVPLVIIGAANPDANADVVCAEIKEVVLDLVKKIKDLGHKRVGFIGENLTAGKLKCFKSAMRQVGLPTYDKYIYVSEKRFGEAGEDGMRAFIEGGDIPSVIITAYDQIALGAMRYARERGYSIPKDISFVGMDDISVTNFLEVPLASIHIHIEDVCEAVVDLLFKRMENRHYRSRTEITIPAAINYRESLAPCRENDK